MTHSQSVGPASSGMFDRVLGAFGVKNARQNTAPLPGTGNAGALAGGITGSGGNTPRSGASSSSSLHSIFGTDRPEPRVLTTPFEFLLSESPITSEKVRYKLTEILFKLDVEQKVKAGMERMSQALQASPSSDHKRQQEVTEKLAESNAKVAMLLKAQQRYQGLSAYADDDDDIGAIAPGSPAPVEDDMPGSPQPTSMRPATSRRPMSGHLKIRLNTANAIPNKKSHRSDIIASIKIDGVQKAKSKAAKSRWAEDFDIVVERAQEVEIGVYEKGGDVLSLIWFKLAELDEMLQTVTMQRPSVLQGGPALISRDQSAMAGLPSMLAVNPPEFMAGESSAAVDTPTGEKAAPSGSLNGLDVWLDMEPAGQVNLRINFVPEVNKPRREDGASNDQLLRHRIPHRFEPASNIGAYWCCHCGYMLPLGKKQGHRCTECSVAAHKECMHLVPNLCGLSPALIDQMKTVIDQAEKLKKEKDIMREEQLKLKEKREREEAERVEREAAAAAVKAQQDSIMAQQRPEYGLPTSPHVPPKSSAPDPVTTPTPITTKSRGKSGPRGIGLDDFNFLAVLGKGNFGKVMLAEEKISKQLYAIKVLKKEFIIENDEVESTKSEKRVFLTANAERHPFLVNLHSCFQTESRIYFVMEYVSGGDLMWHIQHQQFSEKRAKYYACEVLLALEYFHKNNIVYRDLKLDNILLSLEGHIKIADYGLCKENMTFGSTTTTFCGTPEFMAPEILLEKPYGRAVDWWALGVLIYEMLLGQSPFKGDDEDQIFEAILEDEIVYPVNMAKDAVGLLQKDPTKRLGSGKGDAEDIKRHPYFKGVNWDEVLALKHPPPFYPTISSPTDVSNFDEEFTKEMPVLTPCNSVLSAADQEEFRGFTYIR
ncbi:Serine/threonine kinase [Irineochytrium annulatum]|nr:Serine/threonine kinase [Irineochytrium annulatum]